MPQASAIRDAHGLSAGEEAPEKIGVRHRERRRRDLRRAVGVLERARVGKAVGVGADRAHEHGDGSEPRGARRTLGTVDDGSCHSPIRPSCAPSERRRRRSCAGTALFRASSSSKDRTPITSASIPPCGVPTLSPSAASASAWDTGAVISPLSGPRTQTGTTTFSVWTFAKPRLLNISSATATAARSPGEPASRGPARSVSSRTHSEAREPAAIRSRSPAATTALSAERGPASFDREAPPTARARTIRSGDGGEPRSQTVLLAIVAGIVSAGRRAGPPPKAIESRSSWRPVHPRSTCPTSWFRSSGRTPATSRSFSRATARIPLPWTTSGGATSARASASPNRPRRPPRPLRCRSRRTPPLRCFRPGRRSRASVTRSAAAALRIAENMEASLAVPTATTQRQIPIKLADENRRLINEERAASEQSKISFTHVFAWAIVRALEAFPGMNDAFDASSGEAMRVRREEIHFGLAVDVAKPDGSRTLLVPNVKGVEAMTFARVRRRGGRRRHAGADREDQAVRLRGDDDLAHEPGHARDDGVGAASDAGPGRDRRDRRDRVPGASSGRWRRRRSRASRSPRSSRSRRPTTTASSRARSPARSSRASRSCCSAATASTRASSRTSGSASGRCRWESDKNPPLLPDGHRDEIAKQARVLELINAYRVRGHLIADIDPLRTREIAHHPELDLETYGLTIWDLDREFWTGGLKGGDRLPLREIVAVMRRVYCGKIGTEYRHISSPTEKYWIRERIAAATSGRAAARRGPPDAPRTKLIAAEDFERFLGTKFLGQRRYSVEGVDTAIPLLDRLVEGAAARGLDEVVIGMSHRGRLNILANVVGNSAERIFSRLRGRRPSGLSGRRGRRQVPPGRADRAALGVRTRHRDPGRVEPVAPRGRRPGRRGRRPREAGARSRATVRPPGSACCRSSSTATRRSPGQGMVAEVFNLAQLPGYRTGGTIHVVVNNQIGFTTPPSKGRSSVYSTDVAKINQVPIFHVNADDPGGGLPRARDRARLPAGVPQGRRHRPDRLPPARPQRGRRADVHAARHVPRDRGAPGRADALRAAARARRRPDRGARSGELEARQLAEYEAALAAAKQAAQRARPPAPSGARPTAARSSRWRPGCRARRSRASAARSRRCRPGST